MDLSKKVKKPNYWRVVVPPDIYNLPMREVVVQEKDGSFKVWWREYSIHNFFSMIMNKWQEKGSFKDFDDAVLKAREVADEIRFVKKSSGE